MTTLTAPQIETAILADGQTLQTTITYSNLVKVSKNQRRKALENTWYVGLNSLVEVENTIVWLERRGYVASQSTEGMTANQFEITIDFLSGPSISNNTGEIIEKRLRELREI